MAQFFGTNTSATTQPDENNYNICNLKYNDKHKR